MSLMPNSKGEAFKARFKEGQVMGVKSVERAAGLILAAGLRDGALSARWGMVRRDLTRWQRLRTRVRGWLGLAPLWRDEEWVVSPPPVVGREVIRFRRVTGLGGAEMTAPVSTGDMPP